jgi:dihydropyrimidine dehydrogenase (NAD+) subunit PreA
VWKTLGEEGPPVVNVNGPRYGAIYGADRRLLGLNNIELITDRAAGGQPARDQAGQARLAGPRDDRVAHGALRGGAVEGDPAPVEETGADGVELNFGCPHGMSERGMGSAVGQVPEYIEMVTRWCKQHTRMPVIVKLTPNITDIRYPARRRSGRRGRRVADQHDFLITSVDLDNFSPEPSIDGKGSAWRLLRARRSSRSRSTWWPRSRATPETRRPADLRHRRRDHLARRGRVHGARRGTVQVCTAAMTYGFKIVRR